MFPRLKNYPTDGALTLANGATYEILLGENSCNFLRVASANAAFRIRLNDTYEIAMTAGKKIDTLPSKFSKVEVINNSGGNLTFLLEIGAGQISSDEVVLGGTSQVNDALTQAALVTQTAAIEAALEEVEVEINDLMDLIKNRSQQKAPLTDLTNCSRFRVSGATTTVVTSGANVNGVRIATLSIDVEGGSAAYIQIGADKIWERTASAKAGPQQWLENNYFVPAGQQIIFSTAAGDCINSFLEVL